jgi:hypothetical protein
MSGSSVLRATAWRRRVGRVATAWVGDRRGAGLVQFLFVLPVLLLFVVGTWSLYIVYSAHQTLCESTWEAARYLQVEGPMFGDEYTYPDGWRTVATDLVNTSLRNNPLVRMQVTESDVQILPDTNVGGAGHPEPPKEGSDVNETTVLDAWFFVRASSVITHPLSWLFRTAGESGQIQLTCQSTGFYEDAPLGPTGAHHPGATACPGDDGLPFCTAGPPPTSCSGPGCPTATPCKPCKRP